MRTVQDLCLDTQRPLQDNTTTELYRGKAPELQLSGSLTPCVSVRHTFTCHDVTSITRCSESASVTLQRPRLATRGQYSLDYQRRPSVQFKLQTEPKLTQ